MTMPQIYIILIEFSSINTKPKDIAFSFCIFIFQVSLIEALQNRYKSLFIEVVFSFEFGSKIQTTKDNVKEKRDLGFIDNESVIKVGSEFIWLWNAVEC
jgi:hypothetical protein